MFLLTLGVAIFDVHTRLAHLETAAPLLLATLGAAGVDLVHHPGINLQPCHTSYSRGGRYSNYYIKR
jgi:hypothetical protein